MKLGFWSGGVTLALVHNHSLVSWKLAGLLKECESTQYPSPTAQLCDLEQVIQYTRISVSPNLTLETNLPGQNTIWLFFQDLNRGLKGISLQPGKCRLH